MSAKISRTAIPLLAGILITGLFGFRYDRVNNVRVKSVESGDTFVVLWQGNLMKVRLIGIDAPDKDEPLFEDAKKALSEQIMGKLVDLKFETKDARPEFDQAGRWICVAYLGGVCLNEIMVKKGLARVDKSRKCEKLKNIESMENKARSEKLGIWALSKPGDKDKAEVVDVYVGWKHDRIYHKAGCRLLDKYKSEDIIIYSNRDEAAENREPCPACMEPQKQSP